MKMLLSVTLPAMGSVVVALFLVLLPAQPCQGGILSTESPGSDVLIPELMENRKKRSTDQNHGQTFMNMTAGRATGRRSKRDTDKCTPNPCHNGGTCSPCAGSYTCECTAEFVGPNCEQKACRTVHFEDIKKNKFESLPDSFKPKEIRVTYTNLERLTVTFRSESNLRSIVQVPIKKGNGTKNFAVTDICHDINALKVTFVKTAGKKKSEFRVDIDVEEDECGINFPVCESTWCHISNSCYKVFVSDRENYADDTEKFCIAKHGEHVKRNKNQPMPKELKNKLAKMTNDYICDEEGNRVVSKTACGNRRTKPFTCKRPTL